MQYNKKLTFQPTGFINFDLFFFRFVLWQAQETISSKEIQNFTCGHESVYVPKLISAPFSCNV